MEIRTMDGLSDWDDWSVEDGPEWWLQHPLHRPRKRDLKSLQRLRRTEALNSRAAKIR